MPLSNANLRGLTTDQLAAENQCYYSQAVRACLARLQRTVDLLQQPLLSEVALASLHHELEAQTRRLNVVVRHLLPAANLAGRSWATGFKYRPAALLPVLQPVLQEYQALVPELAFVLRPDAAPVIDASAVPATRLVVQLLLDNAVRRGLAGHAIELAAEAADDGHDWTFHVHDGGASLSAAHLSTLFDDPGQVGAGTIYGLGLSLAGFLVEALGGRLWASSAPGQGATFSFSLSRQVLPRRWTLSRPKVLLIEDDAELCAALRAGYEEAGFEVQAAPTLEAGLALMPAFAPSLVLLELSPARLASMGGLADVRRCSDAAVICLVPSSDRESVADALWQGASDCVVKPFHMRELLARTRAILRRRSAPPQAPPSPGDRLKLGLPLRPRANPLLQ
jgi:CheY-like chemotaxis protein